MNDQTKELLKELSDRVRDCLVYAEGIQNQIKDLTDEIKAIEDVCDELSDV